ncbi:hypothetical protein [Aquimarina sp. LLG6339-5]|uniref:FEKKY domain-containing protein n=1 Tax=Aquimarina sp. LLG6339-5 TaxID=3160830 RepID=UPI0038683190
MNTRTIYILLILAFSGFVLSYYNHNNALNGTSFDPLELKYAKRFLGIGILCVGLYFFKKKWRSVLTKIMIGTFGICFALNSYLFIEIYPYVQINKISDEYYFIESCEEIESRFATDLKNGEIKYFQFINGDDYNIELENTLKNKYKIQTFEMGIMQPKLEYYNQLVNAYLKEKYNNEIIDDKN